MIPAYVKNNPVPYLVGGVVLVALGYIWVRGLKGAVTDVSKAAVGVADSVVGGVVVGASTLVGVPETNKNACQQAKISGQTFAASTACSAGEFLKYVWSGE